MEQKAEACLRQFPGERFTQLLLQWFDTNKRDLPWRKDRDPYKIWVSEIMLQQTQVATVIPYFERFMERFPTLSALAKAEEEDVLKAWEGLGYYSRARYLHEAVREVEANYDGQVPDTREEIIKLKGVGDYTAGAILSIAYGQPEPAVDGNVMRVLSRLLLIETDITLVSTRRVMEEAVRKMIPSGRAGDFTESLMELGALVCTPKSPQCLTCPVMEVCRAFKTGRQTELPVKAKKRKPKLVQKAAAVVLAGDQVLISRRPDQGLLAKLYQFPSVEWGEDGPLQTITRYLRETCGIATQLIEEWGSVQHTFTHLKWDITVYRLNAAEEQTALPLQIDAGGEPPVLPEQIDAAEVQAASPTPTELRWVKIDQLEQFPFPVSHQKIKAELYKKLNLIHNA